jgi:hypothetical protein
MPVISRNKVRFEDNNDELKPEVFGINCLNKNVYQNSRNNRQNDDFDDNESSNFKFWLITILFILAPSILISRSTLIKINFNKPIKANYIE